MIPLVAINHWLNHPSRCRDFMLDWWTNLSLRGRLVFWAVLGILINLALMQIDIWIPGLLYSSIFILIISPALPNGED